MSDIEILDCLYFEYKKLEREENKNECCFISWKNDKRY